MGVFCRACLCVLIYLVGTTTAHARIANEIEARTEQLREGISEGAASQADSSEVKQLEAAIRRGEAASGRLRQDIQALEEEKASLERIQTILTSGLIGALVTAAVALLGLFVNLRNSRAQSDLRRLEVIEKAHMLNRQGVHLPEDFMRLLSGTTGDAA